MAYPTLVSLHVSTELIYTYREVTPYVCLGRQLNLWILQA